MILHNFIHFFAVMAVSCLIFSSRERIIDTFFNHTGIFQNSEKQFVKQINATKEDIMTQIEKRKEVIIPGVEEEVYDAKEYQIQINNIEDDKRILEMLLKENIEGEWKVQKDRYKSVMANIGKKFKSLCLFIGLTTLMLLIFSSFCREHNETFSWHTYNLIAAFDCAVISYFIIIFSSNSDHYHASTFSAVVCFFIEFYLCAPVFLIKLLGYFALFNGFEYTNYFKGIFLFFVGLPFIFIPFVKTRKYILIAAGACMGFEYFFIYLNPFNYKFFSFVSLTLMIFLILIPWIGCFFSIYRNAKSYERYQIREKHRIEGDLRVCADALKRKKV